MKKTLISIITFMLLFQMVQIANAKSDFPMKEGNVERTHAVDASNVSGTMTFQFKLPLGYSISQPIVVGDYIYHLAATPNDLELSDSVIIPAGTYLWRIPVTLNADSQAANTSELWDEWEKTGGRALRLGDYANNRSTPTYADINGKPIVYVGWGEPNNSSVVAVDSNSMVVLGAYTLGTSANPNRLVSAPHSMGDDLVVFGDQKNSIVAVKGLAAGSPEATRLILSTDNDASAEVTGTTTQVSNTDIVVGVNFRGKNKASFVQRITVIDNGFGIAPSLQKVWHKGVQTSNGVPTSIAYSKQRDELFFSDKGGNIYFVDATTGEMNKLTRYANQVQLINNSPALGDSSVYFPVRNSTDSKKNGIIIGLNLDGSERFVRWEKNSIAQDPLIVKTKTYPFIFYGTTGGNLNALDPNGKVYDISGTLLDADGEAYAIQFGDQPSFSETPFNGVVQAAKVMPGLNITQNPSVPSQSWLQGGGVATEITYGQDLLLFGANIDEQDDGLDSNDSGELWAYRFVNVTNNLRLEYDLNGSPSVPGKQNEPVVFTTYVTNTGKEDIPSTSLAWAWEKGTDVQFVEIPDGVKAGETVPVEIKTNYPEHSQKLYALVNWKRDRPILEETWDDNLRNWDISVIEPKPNLKIIQDSIKVTNSFSYGDNVSVSFDVLNEDSFDYKEPITTTVTLYADGQEGDFDHNPYLTQTITVGAGEQKKVTFNWTVPNEQRDWYHCVSTDENNSCTDGHWHYKYPPVKYAVAAMVNPDQTEPSNEISYEDNGAWFNAIGDTGINFRVTSIIPNITLQAPNKKKPNEVYFIVGKYGVNTFDVKVNVEKDLGSGETPVTVKLTVDGYGRSWTKSKSVSVGPAEKGVVFTVPNIDEATLKAWQEEQGGGLIHDSFVLTAEVYYPGREATDSDNVKEGVIETDELTRSQLTK